MSSPTPTHVIETNQLPVIGVVDESSIQTQYELEYPDHIVIIQYFYFLKDPAHFSSWLTSKHP
ncbi:hypothetical protein QVE09_11420 [Paenibacillus sp. ClWae2A]|uniref:hypothetical protein n=1 Tax=Paenibacillus sp. ClWae2A TaxID=3057177 RepID=UPI0028F5E7C2|nr:hypothetical protein [Paenibacillus sp. ClWae2A]MDT9719516.1 hypothetical protein [Paenibacillus sp. ClWae2A]